MSDARGKTCRPWDPEHYRHVAHSPEAKLPEDDLVFFCSILCVIWTCVVSMLPRRMRPGEPRRLPHR